MLTPATALRYERYDRKNQQITQEEAMGLRQNRRKVNMKDEFYVSSLNFRERESGGEGKGSKASERKIGGGVILLTMCCRDYKLRI